MRPVRRCAPPQLQDYSNYEDAKPDLVSRLGRFCSYCERPVLTGLAVEHIQDKATHKTLIGRWTNFLLSCVNCNSCKSTKRVVFASTLLPDRDNTFAAFKYTPDGKIAPGALLAKPQRAMAESLLKLTGLDKEIRLTKDANGKLIALDRVSQRMEVWLQAEDALKDLRRSPRNVTLKNNVTKQALASGYFSIWMTVFEGQTEMRARFIDAFPGTRESGCFHPSTTDAVLAPNPDTLPCGGKV